MGCVRFALIFWMRILLIPVSSHCANMNACILGFTVPNKRNLLPVDDHRYFYCEETGEIGRSSWVGRYTCGAAREAMARFLLLHGKNPHSIHEIVLALTSTEHSSS